MITVHYENQVLQFVDMEAFRRWEDNFRDHREGSILIDVSDATDEELELNPKKFEQQFQEIFNEKAPDK